MEHQETRILIHHSIYWHGTKFYRNLTTLKYFSIKGHSQFCNLKIGICYWNTLETHHMTPPTNTCIIKLY